MEYDKEICYASPGISLDVFRDRVLAQKCCIYSNIEIPVEKLESKEDLNKLNLELGKFTHPTDNIICNHLKECKQIDIENLTVNAAGCNLKCYMCDCSYPPMSDTKRTYFSTLEKIKGFKLKWLYLSTGGEPFIWKKETIDYILSLDKDTTEHIDITTNGILLNNEDIEKLTQAKVDIRIAVSISGITEDIYTQIHRNKNFKKVMENIIYLRDFGFLRNVNVVICQYNIDFLEDIIKFWQGLEIPITFLTVRNRENIEEFEQFKLFKKRWPNYDLVKPFDLPTSLAL